MEIHATTKRAVDSAKTVVDSAKDAVEQTKRIYAGTPLTRTVLAIAAYAVSRWLLETADGAPLRVAVALLPAPFFAWFLWTWINGLARMDELERRIELEALGFAFPVSIAFLATLGLLDVALRSASIGGGVWNAWLMMPMLYYIGLWRAQRRYR